MFEQHHDLVLGERGGRLIEDEDARVFRERLDDFDELPLPDAEVFAARGGIDLHLELLEQPARFAIHAPPVDEPEPARLVAEEDVLRHRHARHERELLVDDGDARAAGIDGRAKVRRRAADHELAFIRAVRMKAARAA